MLAKILKIDHPQMTIFEDMPVFTNYRWRRGETMLNGVISEYRKDRKIKEILKEHIYFNSSLVGVFSGRKHPTISY